MTFEEYVQKHLGEAGFRFEEIELVGLGWAAHRDHSSCSENPNSSDPASRQALEGEPVDVERITDTVSEHLGDIFACTRVWSAWQVGTMTQDDFTPADETELADEIAAAVAEIYTHPASAVPNAEYIRALQDAFDIIQADANTEQNYGSLCRMGWVLANIKANQEQGHEPD